MSNEVEATHVAKPSRAGDPASGRGTGGAAPGRAERSRERLPEEDPLAVVANAEVNTAFAFALRQALKEAAPEKPEVKEEKEEKEEKKAEVKRKRCADCWNCIIFKDENGHLMGRCKKNLWLKPTYSYEDINNDRVRRWHADCPEYDDSE
ncbi:MAG: hypothetical protein C4289_11610 [Chloroflexota bacterium]